MRSADELRQDVAKVRFLQIGATYRDQLPARRVAEFARAAVMRLEPFAAHLVGTEPEESVDAQLLEALNASQDVLDAYDRYTKLEAEWKKRQTPTYKEVTLPLSEVAEQVDQLIAWRRRLIDAASALIKHWEICVGGDS